MKGNNTDVKKGETLVKWKDTSIEINLNDPSWGDIVAEQKFFAGGAIKWHINKMKKFIPDTISTHVFHTNHIRPMLKFCINHFKDKKIVGCEIGVHDGKHVYNMLYHLNTEKVYLVDSWTQYKGYVNHVDIIDELNAAYESCKKRLEPFGDRAVYIKKLSHEAVHDIKEKLDFCYLDANHQYEYVKRDLDLYWGLMKKGGIFGGHDFCSSEPNATRAILEFADKYELKIHGHGADWWAFKK